MSEEQVSATVEHLHESSSTGERKGESTGIPSLDLVLGGGLPERSLGLIVGPPGSGKTTLANQIAFSWASRGKRTVVFTALSEPTNKLVAHLRTFAFFEQDVIGENLQFLSLQQFLEAGLEETANQIVALTRQGRADLVVIDGFRGIGAASQVATAREFLYDVGTKLSVLGGMTLLTSEADPRDPIFFPEATTADVIIGIHYALTGVREHRGIEIVKARGQNILGGLHAFRLGNRGAQVYPRLESRARLSVAADVPEMDIDGLVDGSVEDVPPAVERATFDLPELDSLFGGGLPRKTSTLLLGSQGTGKTIMALHFALAGVRAHEPTLFVGFRESREQILRTSGPFAYYPQLVRALQPGGSLLLQRWPAVELEPDIVADTLLRTIDEHGTRRLVLDGIGELERAIQRGTDPQRVYDFFSALVEALRQREVTSLFVTDYPRLVASEVALQATPISILAENLLLFQQVHARGQLHRVLAVLKMRYSTHDETVREFTITAPEGIRVLSAFESDEQVLVRGAEELEATSTLVDDMRQHSTSSSGRYMPSNVSTRRGQPTSIQEDDTPRVGRKICERE